MAIQVTNNAYSTLASSISNSATSFSVAPGGGARFPTLGGSDWFYAVIEDALHNIEIVKVTARAGDLMTVVRAQESTSAVAFPAGSAFELRMTAQTVQDLFGSVVQKDSSTGGANMPAGTTAQRPGTPGFGVTRANSTTGKMEWWNGSAWAAMGGGATGSGGDDAFYENTQTITADYTITSGKNAMTAGPVTINSGVTVTVPSGSTWTIV